MTNSWAGGFQADVTVTAGASPINGWMVSSQPAPCPPPRAPQGRARPRRAVSRGMPDSRSRQRRRWSSLSSGPSRPKTTE
ncbi:hypothetical protein ACWCHM_16155 [Micromonospora sp. SCSIO 07396]